MFGSRGPRKGSRLDGPVAIPRGERVQLRTSSTASTNTEEKDITNTLLVLSKVAAARVEPTLPSPQEAANNPAWFGQTLEYAAGVSLRHHVLEPLLQDETKKLPEETARLLSYYSRGQLLFLQNASGAVHVGSVERVTNKDGPTLASWWEEDKVLSYTNSEEWSDWWIRRCHLFDPGCEMIKLMGEDGETLAMAYYERNIVDKYGDGKRITLIRGIRIDPKLNPDAIRRSSLDRNGPVPPIAYAGVAAALLYHVIFTSIRYGTNGVAVNCPKADAVEDLYQHYLGMPHHIDPHDGRRFFRIDERLGLLRVAFREQLDLILEYKDQIGMCDQMEEEENEAEYTAEEAEQPLLQKENSVEDAMETPVQQEEVCTEEAEEVEPDVKIETDDEEGASQPEVGDVAGDANQQENEEPPTQEQAPDQVDINVEVLDKEFEEDDGGNETNIVGGQCAEVKIKPQERWVSEKNGGEEKQDISDEPNVEEGDPVKTGDVNVHEPCTDETPGPAEPSTDVQETPEQKETIETTQEINAEVVLSVGNNEKSSAKRSRGDEDAAEASEVEAKRSKLDEESSQEELESEKGDEEEKSKQDDEEKREGNVFDDAE